MAVSQSLTSIMEEMLTKVMEDAVSTSVIFTQDPVKDEHKVSNEVDQRGHEDNISCLPEENSGHLNLLDAEVPLHETRRRLFHVSSAVAQKVTRKEEEEEAANEMILEEQEFAALREAEAEIADAKNNGEAVVRMTVEELLLHVVGEKAGVDVSSDFFSQEDSSPGLEHPHPCSQDFAFFKAIERTREDVTLEDEESQENDLAPPSQFLCSPSTSELCHLMRSRTPPSDHNPTTSISETSRHPPAGGFLCQATLGWRPNALVTPGPDIQLLPLTQNCSIVTEQQQDSQEDLFSSQEEEPEQKRRKTLQSAEVGDCLERRVGGEHLAKKDVASEYNDYDRDSDEDDALPLTFHIKDDILRKLEVLKQLDRGREIRNVWVTKQSGNTTCFGGVEEKSTIKVQECEGVISKDKGTRNSMEKVKVATAHGLRSGNWSTGETCQQVKQEIKMEAAGEAGHSRKLSNAASDKERGEGTWRRDSYEDDSAVVGNSKQDDPGKETDVKTRSHLHQPLLLHRAPRLGLSRLQKPSGIHDITIIKDISFDEASHSDCEVSFIKEE